MGFRCSIFSFDAAQSDAILAGFGLAATAEDDAANESQFSCGCLDGRYLLWHNTGRTVVITDEMVDAASAISDIAVLTVNETVMVSSMTFHSGGKHRYSVFHEAEKGPDHLVSWGNVPAAWQTFRDQALAQVNDGYDAAFEAPVAYFESLTGARHDASLGIPFKKLVLQRVPQAGRKPFWKIW
ncbi:MAG: hypothetical protein WBA92_00075 [Pseudorhodobacter sp.]